MKFSTIITYLTLQTFTYINDSSAAAVRHPEDLSFSYEYPEDLSFSYDYPTISPSSPSPTMAPVPVGDPYCPSSILEERTFYAHGPALPYCFKIELFPGGRLIADMDDPTCSEEVFTESLTVSTFQGFSENQVNWGAPGDAFGGISKFLEFDDVTEPTLVINYSSFISGVFDVEIELPTCSFPYCPSSDIADTIIYAHGPAVDACFKMELYPGGGLIADTTDPTCSNPKEDFTESVTYSTFQGFSGNQAIWGAAAPGGFSGTFEFLESDDITKPALVVNGFDGVSVFDVGIELSTCSSPYCPKSEIEGRNIKVIGPAPGRFCLIMELYLGGRLIIDTTNQDCQNNEFTESATLSTFEGFNGRQVVWGSPGSYSGTFDFVESDEVVGPELVLNGFDSGVFDVEIKLPTCYSPYCPRSEIEGRTIQVTGPAPDRYCLKMELYYQGKLSIDTTNQDCQNNEFTESAILSTFDGFIGRQAVWDDYYNGIYSGTIDFVEFDECEGTELVVGGFDSSVFDVLIILPTCAV